MSFQTISPLELQQKLQSGEEFQFIDVREAQEYEWAKIPSAELLPLSRFSEWHDKLNPAASIVVMCHHGVRSAQVCAFLTRQGFEKVWNLSGGIDAWSVEVDHEVPRY